MGMMVGFNNSNIRTTRIQIKDIKGNVVGTITTTKSKKKKPKRLQYNFKQISSQILKTKTSASARSVVTKARTKIAELLRQRKSNNFDDRELEAAIIHAKKMERIARKRMKHLKEEESAKQQGFYPEENEEYKDLYEAYMENSDNVPGSELSKEELMQMLKELQEIMEESMDELMNETSLEDLNEELMNLSMEDLDTEDLERLKKKHRCDELREIMEADMKYLKALFDKFEKEKQANSNGSNKFNDSGAVSLEISGLEIPVDATAQSAIAEGGTIDLSV